MWRATRRVQAVPEKKKERKFYKIFFTTDVHGSERTFRKFLTAGKMY